MNTARHRIRNLMFLIAAGVFIIISGTTPVFASSQGPSLSPTYDQGAGPRPLVDGVTISGNIIDSGAGDASSVENGTYTLTARATDGTNTGSASIEVNVDNTDTQNPTVNIDAPAAGSTVQYDVVVSATASDNVGVTKVELYVNGVFQ